MFPAYADGEERRGESQPLGNSGHRVFSSFESRSEDRRQRECSDVELARMEKKRRQREEERRRLLSPHAIKMVSLFSDDDSDIDISEAAAARLVKKAKKAKKESSRKRKNKKRHSNHDKKKRRKKEKRRHKNSPPFSKWNRRSPSSSSSSSYSYTSSSSSSGSRSSSRSTEEFRARPTVAQLLFSKGKWSFLKEFDPGESSSFLVHDLKADRSNFDYDSIYKGEMAGYEVKMKQVLCGNEMIDELIFGPRKVAKPTRYFDEKLRKSWPRNPEKFWRRCQDKPFSDFIKLSNFGLDEDDLKGPDGELDLKKFHAVESTCSLAEADPQTKSQLLNKQLAAKKDDVELWLRFLSTQDEIYLAQDNIASRGKSREVRLTDRELLERKLAILDKAVSFNPTSVKLKVERIKVGRHIWDASKYKNEVATLQFFHVNDPKMWAGVLDLFENDNRHFILNHQLQAMGTCLTKLYEISTGSMKSHPPLPGTEEFVADVIIRRIRLLLRSGFTEKAIACAQAVCEFNLCRPKEVTWNIAELRNAFERFWDSACPRIGDEGAKGWAASLSGLDPVASSDKEKTEEEDAELGRMEDDYLKRVGAGGEKRLTHEVWYNLELLRTQWNWRPVRSMSENVTDVQRCVLPDDVCDVLYPLKEEVMVELLFKMLQEFGATIYGRELDNADYVMREFGCLPDFSVAYHNFGDFLLRFIGLATDYLPAYRDHLSSSELLTRLKLLQQAVPAIPNKEILKRFRSQAKAMCTKDSRISLFATYAELLLECGDRANALKAAGSILASSPDIWKEPDRSKLITFLRAAIVFISATDDENKRRDILKSLIILGNVDKDAKKYSDPEIEKKVNTELSNAVFEGKDFTTWEGSTLDLLMTIILLNTASVWKSAFLRSLTKLKKGLSPLHCEKRHCFVKKSIVLVESYLKEHKEESPQFLNDELKRAVENFPRDIGFLKKYIELNAYGLKLIRLRRFLEEKQEDPRMELCRSLGAVYLEFLRFINRTNFEGQCPEVNRIRAVLENGSERVGHQTDIFWRTLLFIAAERKDINMAREAFYMSQRGCAWSKALIMDFAKIDKNEYLALNDAIVERGLRMHCDMTEEVMLLMDQAAS